MLRKYIEIRLLFIHCSENYALYSGENTQKQHILFTLHSQCGIIIIKLDKKFNFITSNKILNMRRWSE